MSHRFLSFLTVAVHAFVPWTMVLFALSLMINVPRAAFILLHYAIDVLFFGVVFHSYYQTHERASPFATTIFVLISLFIFEMIFWIFFVTEPGQFLNFIDWIFPAFLIATTVYAIGKKGW